MHSKLVFSLLNLSIERKKVAFFFVNRLDLFLLVFNPVCLTERWNGPWKRATTWGPPGSGPQGPPGGMQPQGPRMMMRPQMQVGLTI